MYLGSQLRARGAQQSQVLSNPAHVLLGLALLTMGFAPLLAVAERAERQQGWAVQGDSGLAINPLQAPICRQCLQMFLCRKASRG